MTNEVVEVGRISLSINLTEFSRWLWSQNIAHRIVEDRGEQVLFVESSTNIPEIANALHRFMTDEDFRRNLVVDPPVFNDASIVLQNVGLIRPNIKQAPLTFLFMAICIFVALLSNFGQDESIIRYFLIIDPQSSALLMPNLTAVQFISIPILDGQWWRYITPDFLHFSFAHIAFNLVLFWYLGGQIERLIGQWAYLLIFVITSVLSNVAQLVISGPLFGGMSGVVYAFVGFSWLYRRRRGGLEFPEALMMVSVGWLLLGYTPVFKYMGIGNMANTAHLAGLIAGMALAMFWSTKEND
jgi:GlpG protein